MPAGSTLGIAGPASLRIGGGRAPPASRPAPVPGGKRSSARRGAAAAALLPAEELPGPAGQRPREPLRAPRGQHDERRRGRADLAGGVDRDHAVDARRVGWKATDRRRLAGDGEQRLVRRASPGRRRRARSQRWSAGHERRASRGRSARSGASGAGGRGLGEQGEEAGASGLDLDRAVRLARVAGPDARSGAPRTSGCELLPARAVGRGHRGERARLRRPMWIVSGAAKVGARRRAPGLLHLELDAVAAAAEAGGRLARERRGQRDDDRTRRTRPPAS